MTRNDSEEYLHTIVREAWANAAANEYKIDPSDFQEATNLSDYCSDIEEWVWGGGEHDFDRRFNILLRVVKEQRSSLT